MATTWPTSFPQEFLKDSFNYDPGNGMIRTEMETGFPKIRRRFTATVETYSGTMIFNNTQFVIFKTWFRDTLKYGTQLITDFPDPFTQTDTTVRWVVGGGAPYKVQQDGETLDWAVSFSVEKLP